MIQVVNNIIPFKGFLAITFWPFIFTHRKLYDKDLNHEEIHGDQQLECLLVGVVIAVILWTVLDCGWWSLLALPVFLYWYVMEWLVRFFLMRTTLHDAYRKISFEQEAYGNEQDMSYIGKRKHFAWLGYLGGGSTDEE